MRQSTSAISHAATRFAIEWCASHLSSKLDYSPADRGGTRTSSRRFPFRAIPARAKILNSGVKNSPYSRFARNAALGAALLSILTSLPSSRIFPTFVAGAAGAQQAQHRKAAPQKIAPVKKPTDAPMPFHVGETLNYRVAWTAFSEAADATLTVAERRDLFGWSTWHFRVSTHTVGSVRALFEIDDQFDSYTDTSTLESRQYEAYLNELGRKKDQVIRLLPSGETSQAPGPSVAVLPGTHDPLGAFYVLRGVDWKATPEVTAPVYDGHDIYEMRAKLEASSEAISVAAGNFSCSRVSIHVFQHDREISGISAVVWFANDAARTPVQIQAELPFGNLNVELIPSSP